MIAGRIWNGDILTADIKELEKMDASEISPRRRNAKEFWIIQQDGEFAFPVANDSAKLSGRNYEFQGSTLRRESFVRKENFSGESHGDREEFQSQDTKDDAGIHKNFLSIQEDFIYRERRIIPNSTEVR